MSRDIYSMNEVSTSKRTYTIEKLCKGLSIRVAITPI